MTSRIKRSRRTKRQMEQLRAELFTIVAAMEPMTVRQVFYQLVVRGLIAKSENEYKSTVCRLLTEMRKSGELPYGWFLHTAAEQIAASKKPSHLYYFGDRDPSGTDIPRAVEEGLRDMAPGADFTFQVVAVTIDQIENWNLPTRPTKASDTRSKKFTGPSVEVDAIDPQKMRDLASECITQHIQKDEWERLTKIEKHERATLVELERRVDQLEVDYAW